MIVTFGEAMLRLSAPHHERLDRAPVFDVHVGGAELNTAVGLACLQHDVQWVSAVPKNPLGQRIIQAARATGVLTEHVAVIPETRCGLYFLELGAPPRPSRVTYDRARSAMTTIVPGTSRFWSGRKPGTFDWDDIFDNATWFHLSGITPALGENIAHCCTEAVAIARQKNIPMSLDVNYRSKLWSPQQAGAVLAPLLRGCAVVFASVEDMSQLFKIKGDSFAELAAKLAKYHQIKLVASTRRETTAPGQETYTALGYSTGESWESRGYTVQTVDPIGAGDAFAAGVIHGRVSGRNAVDALEFGAAMGALHHTVIGDLPSTTLEEVEHLLSSSATRIVR
jgi:2-dehydro-3-deoxygluconokinase